ncbi:MAG TPA: pitrilysin family protein, partial [Candidatus Saccharimonadales bacterium]|nr:pitrilysin family protein [Candidatus Saccharimonadales bacterium]
MKHSIEELILANGSRGLLIDVPGAAVMSYEFQFRAGDQYVDDKAKYETAHIMEHMAFGANERYKSSQEFSAVFQENGAHSNAFTGPIAMSYVADCAEFEWDRILDLQQLTITKPKFLADELLAETGNVQEELTGYLSNNNRVLWQRMWQDSGYPILSDEERLTTIKQIGLEDIVAHHRKTHTLGNMRFIIAGNLKDKRNSIQTKLESWDLPKGDRFTIPKESTHAAAPVSLVRHDIPNIIFGLSFSLNEHFEDDAVDAMGALNHILTGTMHSRIWGKARTRGLCYGMWSDIDAGSHVTEWSFGGQVSVDNIDALFEIIIAELQKVIDGDVLEAELAAAKKFALGHH